VSFATITLCVASQRVIPTVSVYFGVDSVRELWIHPRIFTGHHIKRITVAFYIKMTIYILMIKSSRLTTAVVYCAPISLFAVFVM